MLLTIHPENARRTNLFDQNHQAFRDAIDTEMRKRRSEGEKTDRNVDTTFKNEDEAFLLSGKHRTEIEHAQEMNWLPSFYLVVWGWRVASSCHHHACRPWRMSSMRRSQGACKNRSQLNHWA